MTILYFSSTGNCLQVAKRIGGTLLSIPQMVKEKKYNVSDDVIGIIFPIYGFALPKIVNEFITSANLKAEYIFAVGTYGKESGATMLNLSKLAEKRNIKINYSETLLMVDNYLQGFEMKEQIAMLPEKKTEENLNRVVSEIQNRTTKPATATMTKRAMTAAIKVVTKQLMDGKVAQTFIVNGQCTKCGVCAKVCPAKNITVADQVMFADRCEACLGCVHNCPSNAIHLKNEKSAARFRNSEVTLKELIDANCQL